MVKLARAHISADNGAEDPHATHDEVAPGTGSRVIPGGGVIDRPAPAGSGEELALPRGGRSLPPSPNFPTKSRPRPAGSNSYPPTTERRSR